ncbi:hypothetical protein RRF57_012377 [Xylaria bambusicola]|uniref:Uncharacterized protein n=1 Tax=Xylaria bambusicola TaxID=326684 RepID=A0AAN7Z4G8_9PEZI
MQCLPDPVGAIDHGVVKEEDGVDRRTIKVAGNATGNAVASRVQAKEAIIEATLQFILEEKNRP